MRNERINTIHYAEAPHLIDDVPVDPCVDYPRDISLNRMIINDLDFGVGHRPTLPSCYDDEEDIKNGEIDYRADIKYNAWDVAATACLPTSVTPPKVDDVPTPTPTEE